MAKVARLIKEGFRAFRQQETAEYLKQWLFLLSRKDREVVELVYGLKNGICRNRSEVARLIGRTRMRVKQRHDYALAEILDAAETTELPDNLISVACKMAKTYGVHLKKEAARYQFRLAVNRGDIIRQPCEKCGSLNAEGHHDDYNQPLKIQWLCRAHHRSVHFPHLPMTLPLLTGWIKPTENTL